MYDLGSSIGTTVAGNSGAAGSTRSELYNPYAIQVTANSTMFILDATNYRVLRWQLGDPVGYVVAGGNGAGATFSTMGTSYGLFLDSQYNIFLSEYSNHRITRWAATNQTAGSLVCLNEKYL